MSSNKINDEELDKEVGTAYWDQMWNQGADDSDLSDDDFDDDADEFDEDEFEDDDE